VKPIIDHLIALLAQTGITAHYVTVPDRPAFPYVLLWSTPGQPGIEASITADEDMSDLLGVTMVDTTPGNVLLLSTRTRGLLDTARLTVDGMLVTLSRTVSQTVQPDEAVTLPDTNQHPCFAVDRYQMVATPA
jgi:hypothetical protein